MADGHLKLPLARRIIAVGCVVSWLMGVSACSLEALLCCDSHRNEVVADAEHEHSRNARPANASGHDGHEADAHHAHDAEAGHSEEAHTPSHSHDSEKQGGQENSCCSTLKAPPATAKSLVITKPILQSNPSLCVLLATVTAALYTPDRASDHPPPCPEWVFTPVVSLGPAHRSHAPPSLS